MVTILMSTEMLSGFVISSFSALFEGLSSLPKPIQTFLFKLVFQYGSETLVCVYIFIITYKNIAYQDIQECQGDS